MHKIVTSMASVRSVEQFYFGTLTGTNWKKIREIPQSVFNRLYIEAHKLGTEAIIEFWRQWGATQIDGLATPNRVVYNGLEDITNTMVANANSTAMPSPIDRIQLARDPISSYDGAQTALSSPITDTSGLQAPTDAGVVITNIASGSAGAFKDTIQLAKTFTVTDANLVNTPGEGVESAGILNLDGSLYAATGVSPERLLATNGDQLVVTYKSRLVG